MKLSMTMRVTLALLFLFVGVTLQAQTFENCFAYIKNNKLKEAIDCLEELQKDNLSKADASICLAMLKAEQHNYPTAFDDFKLFYKYASEPAPYLFALSESGIFRTSETNYGKDVSNFFQDAYFHKGIDPSTKLLLTDLTTKAPIQNADLSNIQAYYNNIGTILNWSTVGIFENISGSGFNRISTVIEHPGTNSVFINKHGAKVKWFNITANKHDAWIDLENHYDEGSSVIFAQTFLSTEDDRNVTLKIGVHGSLKVWVNDALVSSEEEERRTAADFYSYNIKLKKGGNRIVLQLGCSEFQRSKFIVRLFDDKNEIITDIASSATPLQYSRDSILAVKKIAYFPESYFEQLVESNPKNFLYKVLLLQLYQINERKTLAYKLLAELKKEAPNCTLISELAIKIGISDNNALLVSEEKESIVKNDPNSYTALSIKADEAFDKEAWSDVIKITDQILVSYGRDEDISIKRITALLRSDQLERAKGEFQKTGEKFPNSIALTAFQHYWIANSSKDLKASTQILLYVNALNYSKNLVELAIENFLSLGNKAGATKQFDRLLINYPADKSIYRQYAFVLYKMQEYDSALAICRKGLEVAPYDGYLFYVQGLVFEALKNTPLAIQSLTQSVQYAPWSILVRAKLDNMMGNTAVTGYIEKNDVAQLYAEGVADQGYVGEDAVMLLNDKSRIVYPNRGPQLEANEILVLLKSKASIEQFKELNFDYNDHSQKFTFEKAEVLKKDGSIVPAQRKDAHCVFSSLAVGDAIHVLYWVESSYEGSLSEHFWDKFYFDGLVPVKSSKYTLITGRDATFNYKIINGDSLDFSKKDSGLFSIYKWQETNLSKVVPEMSMRQYPMKELVVSSIPNWEYVDEWYNNLSSSKTVADYTVNEQVSAIILDQRGKTEFEKAKRIYSYIANNLHYINVPFIQSAFTPQKASKTLRSRLGDCKDLSSLFVAMAKSAGLKANLVLVSTRGRDDNGFVLPTIDFNHCVVHLVADHKDHYIELTNGNLPFGAIDFSLANATKLEIKGGDQLNDTITHVPRTGIVNNNNIRESQASFNGRGLNVTRKVTKIGTPITYFSQGYKDLDAKRRTEMLQADITNEFKREVRMTQVNFPSFEQLVDTAVLTYSFNVDNYTTELAGMSIFTLPWTDANILNQLFTTESRIYAMDISYFTNIPVNTEVLTINLPAGKKLLETPKDVSVVNDIFDYSLKFKVVGAKVTATRKITFLKDVILPEQYLQIKAAVKKIGEIDGSQLAFK